MPMLGVRYVGEEAVLEAYDGLHRVRWNYERDLPSVEFEAVGKPEMVGLVRG